MVAEVDQPWARPLGRVDELEAHDDVGDVAQRPERGRVDALVHGDDDLIGHIA